jgi:hypothetical protein
VRTPPDIDSLKVLAPGLEGAESVGAEPPTILPDPLRGGGFPQTVSLRFDAPRGKAGKEVTVLVFGRSETDRIPFAVSASATVPGSSAGTERRLCACRTFLPAGGWLTVRRSSVAPEGFGFSV